jgi:hypothetical protein
MLLHRGFCYPVWTKSRCRVDDAVGQRRRSAAYSTPSVRSQLITSILSLRWLGYLLGTFLQYNTNQSDELSIFATVRESREARSCDRPGCESLTERRLSFLSLKQPQGYSLQ